MRSRGREPPRSVALAPWLGAHAGGLTAAGRF
jgi:hypothetical protein